MQVGKIPRINLEGQYIYVSLCLGGIVVVVSSGIFVGWLCNMYT